MFIALTLLDTKLLNRDVAKSVDLPFLPSAFVIYLACNVPSMSGTAKF